MSGCCGKKDVKIDACDPCAPPQPDCAGAGGSSGVPALDWFGDMTQRCYDAAQAAKEAGRGVVGIMCEYTPREIIMAAGALPVCLCGGDAEMIPAAEEHLPANLCPLIKSTYGFCVNAANPFLEMADLLVAETTCDGKKKMYELLAEHKPMVVLELPQQPDKAAALAYWVEELRQLRQDIEKRFNVTISDDDLREAIQVMNRERKLRRDLAALMQSDTPPLTGRELLDLKSLISGLPQDLEQYEAALASLPGRQIDPPAGKRARVLLTGVPVPHGAERVINIIEDSGGLVVCQENCTGLKPILEDVAVDTDDPIVAIAEKYFHLPCSVMTANEGRMDLLRDLVKDYRPDCIVDLVWQACLTYDVESFRVRRLAEDELDLPFLRIETDYSPSDTARIMTRVQALFETARR